MWLIYIKVQWLSFDIKVVGYMIEAGYVIDEYQARAERRYIVRIWCRSDPRRRGLENTPLKYLRQRDADVGAYGACLDKPMSLSLRSMQR